MYKLYAGAGGTMLGNSLLSHDAGPVGHVAASVLPYTGVAVGLYLVTGVGLLVAGFVLRRMGRQAGEPR